MKMTNIDISTLVQMREWLQEQIAIFTIRHKPTKELRALLVEITTKMLEMEGGLPRFARNDEKGVEMVVSRVK